MQHVSTSVVQYVCNMLARRFWFNCPLFLLLFLAVETNMSRMKRLKYQRQTFSTVLCGKPSSDGLFPTRQLHTCLDQWCTFRLSHHSLQSFVFLLKLNIVQENINDYHQSVVHFDTVSDAEVIV